VGPDVYHCPSQQHLQHRQPSASYQIDLKHTRRKGTVSATVDFRPLLVLMGDDGVGTGQESCVLISS
jgi:hypothetical protein